MNLFQIRTLEKLLAIVLIADGNYVNFSGNAESEYVIFTTIDYENEADEIVRDTAFFEDNRLKLIDFKPLGNISSKSYIQSGLNGIDTIPLQS